MADGADLSIDTAKLDRDADAVVRRYLTAGTTAVVTTTKALERRLEAATQSAAGGRLWRAWGSRAYPERGPAQNPAGEVFANGGSRTRGALTFFSQSGVNRAAGGGYEAIPLPAAGSRGRGRQLTPDEWEARTGLKLRPVFRPGHAPILVADDARLSGRAQIARGPRSKRGGSGRGAVTIPIFVLIPFQRFRNTVAVGPIVQASQAELAREYVNAVGSAG